MCQRAIRTIALPTTPVRLEEVRPLRDLTGDLHCMKITILQDT
jgi:hypothetical protein